jgi:hypothetical protein
MPVNQRSYQDHKRALDRARAAGDERAVAAIRQRLQKTPEYHASAYQKAAQAGDYEAEMAIAKRYREAQPDYNLDTFRSSPVTTTNARRLYEAREGKPFEGSDDEAVEYGLDRLRKLEWNDIAQAEQIGRGLTDKISEPERAAMVQLYDAYDELGMSWEGVGEAAKNIALSPSTYIGFGVGGLAAKGTAKATQKAAIEAMRKSLMKKAGGSRLAASGAQAAAEDLAERGARTMGQRMKIGAAAAAPEGAIAAGAADAARQFSTQEEYDPMQGAGAAGVGAVTGGALGGALGTVVGRKAGLKRQAGEAVESLSAAPAGAADRLMRSAIEVLAPDGGFINRANDGDVAGAFRDMMAGINPRQLDPGQVQEITTRAIQEPIREFKAFHDELKQIGKEYGLGQKAIREAADVLRNARKGRSDAMGPLEGNPAFQGMPEEVRQRVGTLLDDLNQSAATVDGAAKTARDIFGQQSFVEEMLNAPEVNVLADFLPGGYIASRSAGRLLRGKRTRGVGKRFADSMGKAANLSEDQAVGPRSQRAIQDSLDDRASSADVTASSNIADRNVATKRWVRGKDARRTWDDIENDLRAAEAAQRRHGSTTASHGGIQGEWAARMGVARTDVLSAVDEMLGENSLKQADLTSRLDAMADDADPDIEMALRDELDELVQREGELARFKRAYASNRDTRDILDTDKKISEQIYYALEEEILKRAPKMSDGAYYQWLKNAQKMATKETRRIIKEQLADKDFVKRAKAQLAAEKARAKARAKGAAGRPDGPTGESEARAGAREDADPRAQRIAALQARQRAAGGQPGAAGGPMRGQSLEGELMPRPRPVGPGQSPQPRPPIEGQVVRPLLGGPQGPQGPAQGPQGAPPGPQGPQGPTGSLPGPQGPQRPAQGPQQPQALPPGAIRRLRGPNSLDTDNESIAELDGFLRQADARRAARGGGPAPMTQEDLDDLVSTAEWAANQAESEGQALEARRIRRALERVTKAPNEDARQQAADALEELVDDRELQATAGLWADRNAAPTIQSKSAAEKVPKAPPVANTGLSKIKPANAEAAKVVRELKTTIEKRRVNQARVAAIQDEIEKTVQEIDRLEARTTAGSHPDAVPLKAKLQDLLSQERKALKGEPVTDEAPTQPPKPTKATKTRLTPKDDPRIPEGVEIEKVPRSWSGDSGSADYFVIHGDRRLGPNGYSSALKVAEYVTKGSNKPTGKAASFTKVDPPEHELVDGVWELPLFTVNDSVRNMKHLAQLLFGPNGETVIEKHDAGRYAYRYTIPGHIDKPVTPKQLTTWMKEQLEKQSGVKIDLKRGEYNQRKRW